MQNRLNSLQILRGAAAISVCLFHTMKTYGENYNFKYEYLLFGRGSIGVPIFFIISGFLMVYTTQKPTTDNNLVNSKIFIIKRIIRIVPLYYILTLMWLILNGTIIRYFYSFNDFLELLKLYFFIPTNNLPPLYVGWTLNYEFFFYMVFGVSILFNKKRYLFIYFTFIIFLLIIPTIFSKIDFINQDVKYFNSNYANLITNPLLLQFLLGVFIGNIYNKININKNIVLIVFFIALGIFITYYFRMYTFIQSDLIICGILVFAVVLVDKSNMDLKGIKLLVYGGDISYSIYLIHPFVIIYLPKFFQVIGIQIHSKPFLFYMLVVFFTIFFSVISYEIIEKRLSNMLRKKLLVTKHL